MLDKQLQKNRILVPFRNEGAVIPKSLFNDYGRVLLPEKWTRDDWRALDKDNKLFLYRSVADFGFWFRWVFLPHKASMEEGMTEEELDTIYRDGLPEFMTEYCADIQAACPMTLLATENKPRHSDKWRMCRVFGTGMFKSTITCEAWPMYLIGLNPNISILLAVRTKDKAERFIDVAKSHIMRNERFQWVHGELRPSEGKWRGDCIVVERHQDRVSPTLEIAGYEGAIEGMRYDIIIGDDLADVTNTRTEEACNKLVEWVDEPLYSRLHPRRRMFMLIGTPHNANDLYSKKKKEAQIAGTWDYKEVPLVKSDTWPPKKRDPNGPLSIENLIIPDDLESAWPQWWTIEHIIEDYVNSPSAFARTRMCQVRDPDTKWFPMHVVEAAKADGGMRGDHEHVKPILSRWPVPGGIPAEDSVLWSMYTGAGFDIGSMFRVISVDLAATDARPGADPDYTVFQLWGYDRNTQARIVLNQLRKQTGDPKVIEQDLQEWVNAYQPHKLLVEANAVDKLYARSLQEVVGCPIVVREWKMNKSDEIRAFRDLVASGLAWIPWANDSLATRNVFESFVSELHQWPDTVHDDTLTAAVHAYTEMRGGGGSATARIIGGHEQLSQLGHHEVDLSLPTQEKPRVFTLTPQNSRLRQNSSAGLRELVSARRRGGMLNVKR